MDTQNLTLSLPKALLKKVRILAAKRDTSISALLSRSLEELVNRDDASEAALERLVSRAQEGFDLGTGGSLRVHRDDLHERR